MATALFGWARSVASCKRQGLPNTQAWPDSRRYRKKIRTILEAARWRLRVYGRGKSVSSCQYLGHIPAMGGLVRRRPF